MECPLKSNGDTRIFVWRSHKDKGEDTKGICVTFTQRKVGQFHSEKEAKSAGPHKRVMYEVKGNNGEVYS